MQEHACADQVGTAFWSAIPPGWFYFVFIVATLAAIIASQALISAVFQIAKQALVQGFLPRLAVFHTSRKVSPPTVWHTAAHDPMTVMLAARLAEVCKHSPEARL